MIKDELVKSISAVQDIGVTTRFDEWIFQRGKLPNLTQDCYENYQLKPMATGLQISSKWRKYLPLQWNCQHFALFLAQMSVNTPESNDCVQSILNLRRSQLDSILSKADWGGFAFVTASCLIPVIGGAVGAGMAVGLIFSHRNTFSNLETVQRAYIELESSFEELRRLRFGAYQGNKTSRP